MSQPDGVRVRVTADILVLLFECLNDSLNISPLVFLDRRHYSNGHKYFCVVQILPQHVYSVAGMN